DERDDLYSFGVVLQEMLTGQRPHSLTPVPLPRSVPRRVRQAIRRCLESRKENRFASSAEVNAALLTPALAQKSHVFLSGLIVLTASVTILFGIGFWRQIEKQIEPPPRLAIVLPAPVPQKDRMGLILNFQGPLAPVIEKAMIAGGKYTVVDRDYLYSNLA